MTLEHTRIRASDSGTYNAYDFSSTQATATLADGADAFRTINVDAGEIHLLDGTEFAYTGLNAEPVSVASWVIVDDLTMDDGDL